MDFFKADNLGLGLPKREANEHKKQKSVKAEALKQQ